jgi:hypothetical protein
MISVQQWEYKIKTIYVDEQALNELGKDGWEMCGVSPSSQLYSMALYFKRPKSQEKKLNEQSARTNQMTDEKKDNLIKVKPRKQEENENKDTGHRK